jgi:hypothetical protein
MNIRSILTFRLLRRFSVIGAILAATISPAMAEDFGCKVLLCLANPAGPRAEPQCRDDIDRLYRDLHRGKPMPVCNMASANSSSGSAQAVQRQVWHDECPEGTTSLANGVRAIQGAAPPGGVTYNATWTEAYTGIGETDGITFTDEGQKVAQKVCVGNKVGVAISSNYDHTYDSVDIYDRVVLIDPASSPDVIDVLINGQLNRRVRY